MDEKDGTNLGSPRLVLSDSQDLRQCLRRLWLRYNAAWANQPTLSFAFICNHGIFGMLKLSGDGPTSS